MHIEYNTEKSMGSHKTFRNLHIHSRQKIATKLYCNYIRSILEYTDVVWDNCTQQKSNEIEKIQLEARRITTKLLELNKKSR